MPLTPTQTRALGWLALAVAAWWLLALLAPVLTPFVVAAVVAYALRPGGGWLERHSVPPVLGAALAIVVLMLVLLAVALMIVPVVTRQLPLLRDQLPLLLDHFNGWIGPVAGRWGVELQVDVELVRSLTRQLVSGHESDLFDGLLSSLRIGGSALAAVLGNLVLMPIVAYYLLLDWDRLTGRLMALVPPRWRAATDGFLSDTDEVLGQYLRGQLAVMGLLALFYAGALALAGLQLALPIGVFTGLAVFVPYLGFGLGLVLGLLAAALQFQSLVGVAWVAGVYALGQLLESFLLTPRLVGERIGLHPLAVILALMAFGHVLGFVGVLIALPASAVLLVAVRRLQAWYLGSTLYTHGNAGDAAPPPPGA
jgi:predicted PurR-regulated permease PerM